MGPNVKPKIWKIRTVKDYPQAHTHILVGQVMQMTNAWVKFYCRTYHFGSGISGTKSIKTGDAMIRILPWQRIEIINELDSQFDFVNAQLISHNHEIVLSDPNNYSCTIYSQYE